MYVTFDVPLFFTIHFDTAGVADIPDQIVERWEHITNPGDLSKEGYQFFGWYDQEFPYYPYDFNSESAYKNTTLKAVFILPSHIISSLNINLTLPKAGTNFSTKNYSDGHSGWSEQTPKLTVKSNNSNISVSAELLDNPNTFGRYMGKVKGDVYHYFTINMWPKEEDWKFSLTTLNVYVNGVKQKLEWFAPDSAELIFKVKIPKNSNTVNVKAATKTVKAKKLKKKAQTVSALTIKNKKGKLSYSKVSGSKALTINKTSGKITVKKKTKKGTYKVKIKVRDAGNAYYKSATKTLTVKVKVK